MDHPLSMLRTLLVLALVLPAAAAASVWAVGRLGTGAARRTALYFALLHVAVIGMLTWAAADQLIWRAETFTDAISVKATAFSPLAVPGDPGLSRTPEEQTHATSWTLLTVAPAHGRLPAGDVQFFLGLDGLNVWLVALTSLMTLVAVWVSWESVTERAYAFYFWLFALQTAVIGAFAAFDVILFYVFFELTLIPSFFLIGGWGVGGGRRDAARKFFLYTLVGGLVTLTGIVGVVVTNPVPVVDPTTAVAPDAGPQVVNPANFTPVFIADLNPTGKQRLTVHEGPITFSIPQLMKNVTFWANERADRVARAKATLEKATAPAAKDRAEKEVSAAEADRDFAAKVQAWLFFAVMAGFAVKTPVVPFHTWLPAAYSAAPLAITMLLSALLAKLGTFGILRIVLPLFPDAAFLYGLPVFGLLGGIGIVYGALCAFAQKDVKLLVAYSSVSHLGLLVMGLFSLNREGLAGAALHMVNHGLSTGAMFALLAFLYDRFKTLDMTHYGGLMGRFPGFAFLVFVVSLASVGLPGLNNFVSEMLLLAGLFDPLHTKTMGFGLAATAAAGIFLSAWYTMTMLKRVFFGPELEPATADGSAPPKMTGREWLAFGIPTVFCVVLGLFPQPVLDAMKPDVNVIANAADGARARAGYTVPGK